MFMAMEEQRSRVAAHFRKFNKMKQGDQLLLWIGPSPENGVEYLTAQIAKHKPTLVIIDPVFDLLNVKDVNDYAQVSRALAVFQRIATNANCHLTAIHHNTKAGGDQGREILGSTAFMGRLDCAIVLDEDPSHRRSMYTRQRDGDDMEPVELKLDSSGWITTGRTVSAAKSDELQTEVLDFLQLQTEAVDAATIRNEVGHRTKQVSVTLKSLAADGKINRIGKGKRGNAFKYEKI